MLHDPKWETRQNPTKLENFIAWLETKNPDETYSFFSPETCAVTQYLRAHFDSVEPDGGKYKVNGAMIDLQKVTALLLVAADHQPADGVWTFGRCLARARVVLSWTRQHDLQVAE